MIDLEVRLIEKEDEKKWDDFVKSSVSSTFYHQLGWKNVIEGTYGYKSYYLIAEESGYVKGIFPLFLFENRLLGSKLISVPFGPYGGPCADDEFVEKALIRKSKEIATNLNVKYLEIRGNPSVDYSYDDFDRASFHSTSVLELNRDSDFVLMNLIKRNKRKNIYKSQKIGLHQRWTSNTDDFFKLFTENMRDLGSPTHSQEFFKNIINQFPESAKVLLVEKDDVILYSAFYLFFDNTMINSWSSTLQSYREFYPTDFGIWNGIKYGCENGFKFYDFGRSQKGSTNFEFKRRWGCKSKDLNYNYYLHKSKNIPNMTSENPKRNIFAKCWGQAPLFVVKKLGPHLRKNVP